MIYNTTNGENVRKILIDCEKNAKGRIKIGTIIPLRIIHTPPTPSSLEGERITKKTKMTKRCENFCHLR